jgi:hypothetical protein
MVVVIVLGKVVLTSVNVETMHRPALRRVVVVGMTIGINPAFLANWQAISRFM